ncbi:hypothetical protein AVEN_100126-1 [Araneus ventricosus]|uniref:RNase H type-1 domain-containing protein n=1 Tax=Araneus ventricosus TaxID=182803 RepID=A0A4Y2NBX3_ARAVE|nr:hypothetical protein AVEN_100126-1 [Araneus ventricosus]
MLSRITSSSLRGRSGLVDIFLRWLKAHVGYLGNECADQLAKEAISKGDPFFQPKPLYYLKSEIKSAALSIWQDNWDNGETGRSTHDIVPKVSNKPVGWNKEEIMFVTGHGPFPSYLHLFNLRTHDNCSCGQCTMPQNVGLPSPGISKLQQCRLNYSGCRTFSRITSQEPDFDS